MVQNTSHAVMAQRSEPNDSLDDFPTPPWATRALIMMLRQRLSVGPQGICSEPAANRGYMVRALREVFRQVYASDVHDYGFGFDCADFLFPDSQLEPSDWIISNPPFRLGKEFSITALERCKVGCAMLVRTAFLEGGDRYRTLFAPSRPNYVFQFVERVIMAKGVLRDPSKPYWDEKAKKWKRPSTATSYSWLVWLKTNRASDSTFDWIPQCRLKLERPGDYA